ncbi:MAG: hypothetical protein KatS3mg061_3136 [Dehalococcoidia bacterium]|nr:MAG: hypothetical protein KatS3mg061_3136 [Dehalococcoidia bacterium]
MLAMPEPIVARFGTERQRTEHREGVVSAFHHEEVVHTGLLQLGSKRQELVGGANAAGEEDCSEVRHVLPLLAVLIGEDRAPPCPLGVVFAHQSAETRGLSQPVQFNREGAVLSRRR